MLLSGDQRPAGDASGNDWVNPSVELVIATPEPTSGALVSIGLVALAVIHRRRTALAP